MQKMLENHHHQSASVPPDGGKLAEKNETDGTLNPLFSAFYQIDCFSVALLQVLLSLRSHRLSASQRNPRNFGLRSMVFLVAIHQATSRSLLRLSPRMCSWSVLLPRSHPSALLLLQLLHRSSLLLTLISPSLMRSQAWSCVNSFLPLHRRRVSWTLCPHSSSKSSLMTSFPSSPSSATGRFRKLNCPRHRSDLFFFLP